ncbi:hypothetical protein [Nocardioides jensenii]|uniref:hypothetical protein n=1 Tax=Nocardioides jensenii TaxID=1843 RepID=UPI00082A9CA4|nr:hypothetical protein [Nocardioides jensenii]
MKPRSSRLRLVVACLLVVALVASLVWLVMGVRDRTDDGPDVQADRDKVMLKTREYMLAAFNFGAGDLDAQKHLTAYRDRVTPLITTQFEADFEQATGAVEQAVAQGQSSSKATVDHTAVESLDEDTATVIVGGELTIRLGTKKQPAPQPYAWSITLKKVDGTWLVDKFKAYEAGQSSGQGAGQ